MEEGKNRQVSQTVLGRASTHARSIDNSVPIVVTAANGLLSPATETITTYAVHGPPIFVGLAVGSKVTFLRSNAHSLLTPVLGDEAR